jgi:hypothetical protein
MVDECVDVLQTTMAHAELAALEKTAEPAAYLPSPYLTMGIPPARVPVK